jgi:hypothetical protein
MNINFRASALSLAGIVTVLAPRAALAQTKLLQQGLDNAAIGPYGQAAKPQSLPDIVGRVINIAFDLFGILLLVYMLYGGYLWLTAGGEGKQVETAQAVIKNAVIGVAILVSANFIAGFVLGNLDCAISGNNCS